MEDEKLSVEEQEYIRQWPIVKCKSCPQLFAILIVSAAGVCWPRSRGSTCERRKLVDLASWCASGQSSSSNYSSPYDK